MFFNITNSKLENYPCHWRLAGLYVNTDPGWTLATIGKKQILYKGYADVNSLDCLLEQIANQNEPVLTGNFCALVAEENTIKIKSDRNRSFPVYIGQDVNNLIPTNNIAWADSLVTVNSDLSVTIEKFDLIGKINTDTLELNDVINKISDIIDKKTISFLTHNQLPVRAYLTGGVDSMLVYSFLQKHTKNFELINYSHIDYDYFWLKNSGDIKKNWAYNQIHHWTDACVLTSGTPGDEFMLRSPTTVDLFLKHHNIKISNLLNLPEWKNCLHHAYFSREKNLEIFNTQLPLDQPTDQLYRSLCNIIVNDWQHWHIGNTLTWTPLRDLEIFKLMMRLPVDEILGQAMNSVFSIRLIEHNCPGLSSALSDQKNANNALSNLVNII